MRANKYPMGGASDRIGEEMDCAARSKNLFAQAKTGKNPSKQIVWSELTGDFPERPLTQA